jgi:hypothetical protein
VANSTQQLLLRVPTELVDEIDSRRTLIGEASRNAWCVRAIRWALAQPVKTEHLEVKT